LVRKREFRIGMGDFERKGFGIGLMDWGMESVHFNCIIYLPNKLITCFKILLFIKVDLYHFA
jgi:hypothetical protein